MLSIVKIQCFFNVFQVWMNDHPTLKKNTKKWLSSVEQFLCLKRFAKYGSEARWIIIY